MNPTFTEDAQERARKTVAAARVFYNNVDAISAACDEATQYDMVVAFVDGELNFGGTHTVRLVYLSENVAPLEENGWVLVFSPRTTTFQIEERCISMAQSASKRLEIMKRRASRTLDNESN